MTLRGNLTMTCKIDRDVIQKDSVVLRISGRIPTEHVTMLRALLEQENGALPIDLKDVRLVDGDARTTPGEARIERDTNQKLSALYPRVD
jgi:hypothetical protein